MLFIRDGIDNVSVGSIAKAARISLEVTGAGELLAVGSANGLTEELYVGIEHKAWRGRLMVVIRSTGQAGEITLKAQAEGLAPATLQLAAN